MGDLFERICLPANLFAAWEKFRRGKRSKPDVMLFEYRLEDNIFALCEELSGGRYRHGPYVPFTISDPKRRSIHKATVKDRVVHQAIANVVEPIFERRFIHDSYSCRVGKGTHAAVKRLRTFLRQASMNDTRTVYTLKCDVRRFFASVDHGILLSLLAKRIEDDRVMLLLRDIVGSFSTAPGLGIPLGNLTSQLFANIYLHELDRYVKHDLREEYYLRYCDDFVTLGSHRRHLEDIAPRIDGFLRDRLRIRLHPGKVSIRSWRQGVDFLGYVLMPHCTVLRTKTARRMLKRACSENVASYLGLCGHADAHHLEHTIRNTVWIRTSSISRYPVPV
ncbi:reverse transcriptase/maturase family protein [Patescibacteria group bacterium]|nr:reverse transcriptase/maturase family protein [Patescibacteria group bacterium]MBU1448313.1 reverse transcriptase/maturase family protein [Patescibacteria group bacterium]MBU2613148.1 reverse transcriptase/maturase family protein [Patescibacteria group bacterium]